MTTLLSPRGISDEEVSLSNHAKRQRQRERRRDDRPNRRAILTQIIIAIGARIAAEGARELVVQLWKDLARFL